MTNKEFKDLTKLLKNNKNITEDEKNITIETLKKIYGHCLTCYNNDGYPHSECAGCN